MWDLPGPGIEPVFPALAGGFLTTAPPGKPAYIHLYTYTNVITIFSFYLFIFKLNIMIPEISHQQNK